MKLDDWDLLVILDACRYDYFEELKDILPEGVLLKAVSPAPLGTWHEIVFDRYYDAIVYSANRNIRRGDKRFKEVYDLWDTEWNSKIGTVPPWNVNKFVIEDYYDKHLGELKEKIIVHYLQPHGTWIGKTKLYISWFNKEGLGQDVHLIPYLKNMGPKHVKQLYRDNLKLVLEHVSILIDALEQENVVITSDHGEHLGEDGKYLHTPMWNTRTITEVPWYIIRR